MKNIVEVRDQLALVFQGLKDGTIPAGTATELNNAAGKIINSLKVELEYYSLREEKPEIDFMNKDGGKSKK